MRRTLRGLFIVAGLLGQQGCGEKEGPIDPNDPAAVAKAGANSSATNASARMAERSDSYEARTGRESVSGASLELLRRAQGDWMLEKRDGTTLTLEINGTSGRMMASFTESDERVRVLQEVRVIPAGAALMVVGENARQVGTYNRAHRQYMPDRLRFEHTSGDTFQVFDLNDAAASGPQLVVVRSHRTREPMATKMR